MSYTGFGTTQKGRELLAKMLAEERLVLTKVVAGSGCCEDEKEAEALLDLVQPRMVGTSNKPTYSGETMEMTLQFRSDLWEGEEFWLSEYGIFADDPDEGEILLYYGSLGLSPQRLTGQSGKYSTILTYDVVITLGDDLSGVVLGYPAGSFVLRDELDTLLHSRIQLAVTPTMPTASGVYLWVDKPPLEDVYYYP